MSLSPEQIRRLLEHIGMPSEGRAQCDDLTYLRRLQRLHIQRVPFASTTLHYSQDRRISVNLDEVFEKVVDRGHGGYCMELNTLFAGLLRGLGYKIVTVGGRVSAGTPVFSGQTHMGIIVTIDETRYLVDVGFGSPAAFQPLKMDVSQPTIVPIIGTRLGKLEYTALPFFTDQSQRVWLYSMQLDPTAEFLPQFALGEQEMVERDFEAMNFYTSKNPKSFFVQNVVAMNIVCKGAEQDYAPEQIVTLFNDRVRFSVGNDVKEDKVVALMGEDHRISVLEDHFKIHLTERERKAILGHAQALQNVH